MQAAQAVVFLHEMGESADAWDQQRAALPSGFESLAVDVVNFGDGADGAASFGLDAAAGAVLGQIDWHRAGRVHLYGLSLGR